MQSEHREWSAISTLLFLVIILLSFQSAFASGPVPSTTGTAATITSPTPSTKLTSASATFTWTTGTGITQYYLYVGTSTGKNNIDSINTKATSAAVTNLPTDGATIYVELLSLNGSTWLRNYYTYTASGTGTAATMTSPTPGTKLTSANATFTWTAGTGISSYYLYIGTSTGKSDIDLVSGTSTSHAVTNLPTNGTMIYVELLSLNGTTWLRNYYTYTASGTGTPAAMTSPAPSTKLSSADATFTWTAGTGISQYYLYVGTSTGKNDLDSISAGTATTKAVSNLPTDGSTIYVELLSLNGSTWLRNYYTYTASGSGTAATITSPTPSSTLTNTSITFSWSKGTGISAYYLYVGSASGKNDIASINAGTATSELVKNLPGNGSTIYVELLSLNGATWLRNYYTYTAVAVPTTTHFQTVALNANAIAWDAFHNKIYASLPSADGANGNSIAAINPITATYPTPTFVGSEPNLLSVSSDGSYLLVGLDGANQVQRMKLPALTPDINIALPNSSVFGPQIALALEAAPVSAHTFAVILGTHSVSPPDSGGVNIYDDSTPRSAIVSNVYSMSYLKWGLTDSALYGQSGGQFPSDFFSMAVNASGATLQQQYGNLMPGNGLAFDKSTGFVVGDAGQAANPVTGDRVGAFNVSAFQQLNTFTVSSVIPDPTQPVVFVVGQTPSQANARSGFLIEAFDKTSFVPLRALSIPTAVGAPVGLIRWGNAGLAVLTSNSSTISDSAIYLVDGYFVDPNLYPDFTSGTSVNPLPKLIAISPQSALVGSPSTTLTVTGANFQPTDSIFWNGSPILTTYVSSTELQASISATTLASAGSAVVTVENSSALPSLNSQTFVILSASTGLIVENLASPSVAWDPNSSRLYATVLGTDSHYPNSIVAINPTSGAVTASVPAITDPYVISVSSDGSRLYAGFMTSSFATQFHLPALNSPLSWSLGADSFFGPYSAMDIQTAPGAPQTTAVSIGNPSISSENAGALIYDNNVERTNKLGRPLLLDSLQWGADSATLYAANNEDTAFDFYVLGVSSAGVFLSHDYNNTFNSFDAKIHFDAGTGYIYDDDGQVVNPANGSLVGTYGSSGFAAPDSTLGRVFILGQTSAQLGSNNYTITSFDQSHFTAIDSLVLNNLIGAPSAMVRWGASGLAIATCPVDEFVNCNFSSGAAGMLYILNDSTFVSSARPDHPGIVPMVHRTWNLKLPNATPPVPRGSSDTGQTIAPSSE